MIYTCYDMIRDCRADRANGWSHFVSWYVPVIRKLAAHYVPEQADGDWIGRVLEVLRRPDSSLFGSLDPAPERWFVAELRQRVLAVFDERQTPGSGDSPLDLITLGKAL